MKKYKIASVLMMIHGAFMEIGGCFCLIPIFILGADKFNINEYISFIVPYFQENMDLMLIMGMLYGIVRVIGAVGLWKNRMWGLVLSILNCIITMILMCIPFVNFIMLLVWAFSAGTPVSKANWAKATLIFMLIGFVLVILFWGAIGGLHLSNM